MSPREPQKLKYPQGTEPLRWIPLKIAPNLTTCRVERRDAGGKTGETGGYWKVVEMQALKAAEPGEG